MGCGDIHGFEIGANRSSSETLRDIKSGSLLLLDHFIVKGCIRLGAPVTCQLDLMDSIAIPGFAVYSNSVEIGEMPNEYPSI